MSLSRFAVLLLAVCALLAAPQIEAAATIQYVSYSSFSFNATSGQSSYWPGTGCALQPGSQPEVDYTVGVSGVCHSGSSSSYAYYCSNADANHYYQVEYSDTACTASKAISIDERLIGCEGTLSNFGYICANATDGPTLPFAFPPAGWSVQTSYYNASNGNDASNACSGGAGTYTLRTASLVGVCTARSNGYHTPGASSKDFCNSKFSGSATFSNADCTGTIMTASVSASAGCVGNTVTECTSTDGFPTGLPTQGYVEFQYPDQKCATTATSTTHFVTASCFDSKTITCANGNMTRTSFSDPTNSGLCNYTASASSSIYIADGATCQGARDFFCAADSIPAGAAGSAASGGINFNTAAASTVAVSAFAYLLAAAALVFAKAL